MKLPSQMTVEELRALRSSAVKMEARRRIEAVYPLWKQVNILRDGTADEIQAMRVAINAVRNKSDAIEASIEEMTTQELMSFKVQHDSLWR